MFKVHSNPNHSRVPRLSNSQSCFWFTPSSCQLIMYSWQQELPGHVFWNCSYQRRKCKVELCSSNSYLSMFPGSSQHIPHSLSKEEHPDSVLRSCRAIETQLRPCSLQPKQTNGINPFPWGRCKFREKGFQRIILQKPRLEAFSSCLRSNTAGKGRRQFWTVTHGGSGTWHRPLIAQAALQSRSNPFSSLKKPVHEKDKLFWKAKVAWLNSIFPFTQQTIQSWTLKEYMNFHVNGAH